MGEGRVGGGRERRVEVGIEAVQDSKAGVIDVAVDVVGEQRRQAGKGNDEQDDDAPDKAPAEPRGPGQYR